MATNDPNAQLGTAMPLAYGLVRATGKQIINHTDVLKPPQTSHSYSQGDSITDGTYQQLCVVGGVSDTGLPGSWNATAGGSTTWGPTEWVNQGTSNGDGNQYGVWLLGEGEWDGFSTIWNQVAPLFSIGYNYDISVGDYEHWGAGGAGVGLNPPDIHFHSGTDGATGAGLPTPASNGPDQGCDIFIGDLPAGLAVTAQCYSRIAYYAMKWLPANLIGGAGQAQINQIGQIMNPIGDWRALRCRIFDDTGTQVDYKWTTNPAWHWVDAYLRCKFFQRSEYQINMSSGPPYVSTPTALPSDVLDKFDWGSVYEFSQDCDFILANNRKRFEGNYAFASQTTLAAIVEQILTNSRGYQQEYAGKLFLNMDKARASVFVLKASHVVPRTLSVDHKEVHQNANDYTVEILDILLPAVCDVTSIDFIIPGPGPYTSGQATIVTPTPHPCAPWDVIAYGGCSNTILNRYWMVNDIVDANTFTCQPISPDIASSESGTGGTFGYPQARFSQRAAQLWHLRHAVARGQIEP